jgi:hypothetical protein
MNEDKKKELLQKMIHNILLLFNNDESRKYVQIYLIDPLLNHVLERIFPYIVLTSILFILLILVIIVTCIFIYYHLKYSTPIHSL